MNVYIFKIVLTKKSSLHSIAMHVYVLLLLCSKEPVVHPGCITCDPRGRPCYIHHAYKKKKKKRQKVYSLLKPEREFLSSLITESSSKILLSWFDTVNEVIEQTEGNSKTSLSRSSARPHVLLYYNSNTA